jgi:hypothetical protein
MAARFPGNDLLAGAFSAEAPLGRGAHLARKGGAARS